MEEGTCLICDRPTDRGQGVCSRGCAVQASREVDHNVQRRRRQRARRSEEHVHEPPVRNGQLTDALLSLPSYALADGNVTTTSG